LSFAKERIGPVAAIITTIFYLLAFYLFAFPNTPENPFASIYSESLIKTTCQHLLLLIGFDTLIYQKYYDTPPILVGHQRGICSILAAKKSAFHTTSVGRTKRKKAITTIQRRYIPGGEHGVSSRTKQRREGARSPATSILPQGSFITIKTAALPTLPKTCIQRIHNSMKVTAVFHGASSHSG
jgi:hypothetical protein